MFCKIYFAEAFVLPAAEVRFIAAGRRDMIFVKIVAATQNKGKIKEIKEIFSPLGFEVVSQKEAVGDVYVEETGKTFEENAKIKAHAIYNLCGGAVIADDSGLCVEALGGAPGIYSARYAGEGASDEERIKKLLFEMKDKENRKAKFVTSVVMVIEGREFAATGETYGEILEKPTGHGGFGYDPVFFSEDLGKSFGEAEDSEKNAVSHRGRALRLLYEKIYNQIKIGNCKM